MPILGKRYKIKPGDTLWSISREHLGSGSQWHRIYAYNNSTEAIKNGAKRISNPDVIHTGKILYIPILKDSDKISNKSEHNTPPASLSDLIKPMRVPFGGAQDIELVRPIEIDYGTFLARINLEGRLAIRLGRAVPLAYVSDKTIEASAQREVNSTYNKLLSESSVSFNPASKEIRFSNKMISEAKNISAPKTAIGVEVNSTSGRPVIKAEIIYPELQGKIGADEYVTLEFKITIEIEPRLPLPRFSPIKIPQTRPAHAGATQAADWSKLAVQGNPSVQVMVVTASAVFVLGCFLTYGAGTAAAPAFYSMMALLVTGAAATQ